MTNDNQPKIGTLEHLIGQLEAQEATKKDYVTSMSNLWMLHGNLVLGRPGSDVTYEYKPTNHFHQLLSEKLQIPKKYYDRMLNEFQPLHELNVNWWLEHGKNNVLLRTFETPEGNTARAFLSDNYNMMDNYLVLMEALDAARKSGVEVEVKRAELSDTKMYVQIVAPQVEVQAKELLSRYSRTIGVGTGIISGFVIKNSEIGAGAFSITARAMILACGNGLIYLQDGFRKIHLGAKMDEMFQDSQKVREANMQLIRAQVQHAAKTFLNRDHLKKVVDFYEGLGNKEVEVPAAAVLNVVAREYEIPEARKNSILNYFIKGGDTRRIGYVNAITEQLQDLSNADDRFDAEVTAVTLLENFEGIERKAVIEQQKMSEN